ncbi:catalase family protein [Sphingomonas sp. BK580]|uniref:catalase family protein n=1 Tax=Sphingomonas sp. BK580 TaxID=2586972 RepID=UPI001615A039|nr:catalase family protein [Sphingomonas sp. BK580]MBB3693608.1 hypothetical protein [Sphingomonas sp. BK580]
MLQEPVRYRDDLEAIPDDEADTIQALEKVFRGIVDKTHADLGHAYRGVHAKPHALLEGRLEVRPDLDIGLAQGIFRPGRIYPAVIRMSAIPGDPISDRVSLPRGLSIKVLGVEGVRLPGSEEHVSQDFLLVTGATFSDPTLAGFLRSMRLLAGTTDRAEPAKIALSTIVQPIEGALESVNLPSGLLQTFGGYCRTNPIGERYYSQGAIRFGDYVGKIDLVPHSPNFRALTDQPLPPSKDHDAIRDELLAIFAEEGGSWELRVQLCRDLDRNPVEDASVVWPEVGNPYLPLAVLTVPPQRSWSPERQTELNERTAFSPWQGITEHRPLGAAMRARRRVYRAIQDHRSILNGCPIREPHTLPLVD